MTTTTIETYKAKDGYRWRARAENGRILADSGEAYTRFASVVRAADRFCNRMAGHVVLRYDK